MFIKKALCCHFASITACKGCYEQRLLVINNICLFRSSSYVAIWDNSLQEKKLHNGMYNGKSFLFIGEKSN